ncbi:hypothetical protein Ddye_027387 [Dipteronia dyeriana]|uniref:RNase H type-1 domain-containing protein n=1 Tax=Dipteronia dyeriana TaxID=168575 RepID=A0AAD9TP19_9ROSI|nr:hypothetical protein Ddye_027387 [Dipteronia dyeriana]
MLLNVKDLCVDSTKVNRKRIEDWNPPTRDKLKFNVDGSMKGKLGPAGIGGVLRDANGKVMCLFFNFMGVTDSNSAELWASKKVVQLCLANPDLRDCDIAVINNSNVAFYGAMLLWLFGFGAGCWETLFFLSCWGSCLVLVVLGLPNVAFWP